MTVSTSAGLAALVACALVSACSNAAHEASGTTDSGTDAESMGDGGPGNGMDARDEGGEPTEAAVQDSAAGHDSETPDSTAPGDAGTGYGSDGPVAFTTASLSVSTGTDSFALNVWVPSAAGAHPVVSFSPGLEQPSAGYTGYATRLASWGFVVLMRDNPGILVSGDTVASDLAYTVGTWLPAQSAMAGSVLYGKADLAHVGLAGHSRGGQATLDAAE